MDEIEHRVAVLELIVVETVPWLRDRTTQARTKDELEHRLAAFELIAGELVPWLDRGAIETPWSQSASALKRSTEPDERVIRPAALQVVNDAAPLRSAGG